MPDGEGLRVTGDFPLSDRAVRAKSLQPAGLCRAGEVLPKGRLCLDSAADLPGQLKAVAAGLVGGPREAPLEGLYDDIDAFGNAERARIQHEVEVER